MTSNSRHGLPPRLMAHQPTRFTTAQESKPIPSPGVRIARNLISSDERGSNGSACRRSKVLTNCSSQTGRGLGLPSYGFELTSVMPLARARLHSAPVHHRLIIVEACPQG